MWMSMSVYKYLYIYISIYLCVRTNIYIYIYTYTWTHIHIHIMLWIYRERKRDTHIIANVILRHISSILTSNYGHPCSTFGQGAVASTAVHLSSAGAAASHVGGLQQLHLWCGLIGSGDPNSFLIRNRIRPAENA